MRITKRQLRRIIKEEFSRRRLSENVDAAYKKLVAKYDATADMTSMSDATNELANDLTSDQYNQMDGFTQDLDWDEQLEWIKDNRPEWLPALAGPVEGGGEDNSKLMKSWLEKLQRFNTGAGRALSKKDFDFIEALEGYVNGTSRVEVADIADDNALQAAGADDDGSSVNKPYWAHQWHFNSLLKIPPEVREQIKIAIQNFE